LDRLTYAGENGKGALVYRPSFEIAEQKFVLNFDAISKQIKQVLEGTDEDVI